MRPSALVLFVLLPILAGCMPATFVRVDERPVAETTHEIYLGGTDGAELSRYTRQLLSRTAVSGREVTPERLYAAAARAERVGSDDRALALAELAFGSARRLDPEAPAHARARFLLAAAYADEALVAFLNQPTAPLDGRVEVARRLYAAAAGRVVLSWLTAPEEAPQTITVGGRTFEFSLDDPETRRWLAYVDEFHLAASLDIDGLRTRHVRDGLGVPLVGWRRTRDGEPDWHYGPDGRAIALTAVLRFEAQERSDDGRTRVLLLLRDSRRSSSSCFGGREVPLAADLTAPLAFAWSRSEAARQGVQGLRGRRDVLRHRGFRLVEPYDPARVPVVLVHGLGSSPQVWRNLTNEVLGADALRERYQVWHYAYPTSDPFIVAAARFREDLRALLDDVGAPTDAGLVVVGHSMGGLLAKSLVVDSGDRLWDTVFAVPRERLRAAEFGAALERALVLEPFPEVSRVVFLATPHGGSELADAWWAKLVRTLISPSPSLRTALDGVLASEPSALHPRVRHWSAAAGATSVEALSPRQPLLHAFHALPVVANVPFHSIYGALPDARGRPGDGVVLAADARLDGAASDAALPVRHGEFDTPPVVEELTRILELHAAERPAPASGNRCARPLMTAAAW